MFSPVRIRTKSSKEKAASQNYYLLLEYVHPTLQFLSLLSFPRVTKKGAFTSKHQKTTRVSVQFVGFSAFDDNLTIFPASVCKALLSTLQTSPVDILWPSSPFSFITRIR